jgi:hypothetical protein
MGCTPGPGPSMHPRRGPEGGDDGKPRLHRQRTGDLEGGIDTVSPPADRHPGYRNQCCRRRREERQQHPSDSRGRGCPVLESEHQRPSRAVMEERRPHHDAPHPPHRGGTEHRHAGAAQRRGRTRPAGDTRHAGTVRGRGDT